MLHGLSLTEVSHVIALTTAPSFLLGAVVAFLALLLARAARISDRLYVLAEIEEGDRRHGRAMAELPKLRERLKLDFVLVNGENAAGGFGITPEICRAFYQQGADAVLLGNHSWDQRDIIAYIDGDPKLLRPLNYPKGTPGKGSTLLKARNGADVLVINAMGLVFMPDLNCPFRAIDAELTACALKRGADVVLVDFHAEATSEKQAMGLFLDGRASVVVGTHTHTPTADARATILSVDGDARQLAALGIGDIRAGASWCESLRGTNALGTALVEGCAVAIDSGEHFLGRLSRFSCRSLPLCDPHGNPIGVLDLTREGELPLTLDGMSMLMSAAATHIETRLFDAYFPEHVVLVFHPRRTYLGSSWSGVLAVSEDRRIVAANAHACELLGAARDALVGRRCESA